MLLTDLVTPPDTALCSAAEEMARMASDPFLYNHVSRSYVFGALAARAADALEGGAPQNSRLARSVCSSRSGSGDSTTS